MSDNKDIEKIAVFDGRIVQQSPLQYAVEEGAVSVTNTPFPALSSTTTQHTYQIQCPSENVYVDKAIDWTCTVYLQFNVAVSANDASGNIVALFGRDIALSAFPIHNLVSSLSATINDTTVTMNTSDVIHEVLKLADSYENRQLRTCPTYLDTYRSYNDAAGTQCNPLAGFENASYNGQVPNGAYYNVAFTDPTGNVLDGTGSYVSGAVTVQYRNGVPVTSDIENYPIFIKFTSTEKLVLSPFCWNDVHDNDTGLFGIQNISITANMLQPSLTNTYGRPLRTTTKYSRTVSALAYNNNAPNGGWNGCKVDCVFLTPSLYLPVPSKSMVPYMEFPRYTQSFSGYNILSDKTETNIQSQTITLPCIPDLIIIYAKPKNYLATDGDYYLPITNISVNFDNFSGLLSSLTAAELFAICQTNGLNMDYNSWNGQALQASVPPAVGPSGSSTNTLGQFVGLVGGFLVLKPSRDITLQTGQAPSNVGNYTLQFNYSIYNPTNSAVTEWNLTVITANSGFFESYKGSSRVVKGILSQQDVSDAADKGALTRGELNRYVGGKMSGLSKSISNSLSKVKPFLSSAMPKVSEIVKEYAPMALSAMNSLGKNVKGISKRLM